MEIKELENQVHEAAIEVYKILRAGYEESVYEEAMSVEFRKREIPYEVERNTEIFYKDEKVGVHRLDFILDKKFVVELKAQVSITKSHISQTMAYLKTLELDRAIVVNFPYPEQSEPKFELVKI